MRQAGRSCRAPMASPRGGACCCASFAPQGSKKRATSSTIMPAARCSQPLHMQQQHVAYSCGIQNGSTSSLPSTMHAVLPTSCTFQKQRHTSSPLHTAWFTSLCSGMQMGQRKLHPRSFVHISVDQLPCARMHSGKGDMLGLMADLASAPLRGSRCGSAAQPLRAPPPLRAARAPPLRCCALSHPCDNAPTLSGICWAVP